MEQGNIRKYKKDEVLFRENDICENAGLLIAGKLIIRSYSDSGKEIVYNVITKGQYFGNNLIFSDDRRFRGDVIATEDSEVALFSLDELIDNLSQDRDLLKSYLHDQAVFIRTLNYRLKLLSFDSARERLMFALDSNDGDISYKSITSLSDDLHLSREALSRLITALEKEGTIRRVSNRILKND